MEKCKLVVSHLIKISQEKSLHVQLYCTGFRDFASSLQPLFKMVSHNKIMDDIMKIYEFEKWKMSSYLEKLETRMVITTDMWTSNQKKGYMAITVHYIDESWLLQHHIIRLDILFVQFV